VTSDRSLKQQIRARMREHGEKYTVARRAILNELLDPDARSLLRKALTEGALVASVCGGGSVNTTFLLPELVVLRDAGHELAVLPYDPHLGAYALPSPLDFAVLSGHCTVDDIRRRDKGKLVPAVDDAMVGIHVFSGARSRSDWTGTMTLMAERSGRAPVLFVQDAQAAGPFAEWLPGPGRRRHEFDLLPGQLMELAMLARTTGAIIAIGHCQAASEEDDWRVVAERAADTFVIDTPRWSESEGVEPTIRYISERNGADHCVRGWVDSRFDEWRMPASA
jgi:hypothetical protein